ncbi:MAG: porin family protein [Alphaproteobacteria bacterium]|nr:porin family protein [Alphaproteobacteria bacterium]
MKKRLSSALSLFLLIATIVMPIDASQSQQIPKRTSDSLLNQYRLGVGLGVEYVNASANLKIVPTGTLENIGANQSQVGKNLQVAPCLEVGTTLAQDFYLGLIASWRYSGAKNTSRAPITPMYYFLNEFKLNSYIDVLLKPGYKVTPRSMVYGLIGPSFATWSHTTTLVGTGNSPFKMHGRSLGLGLGVGFEYLFKENYALSFDYTYHFHRSTSRSQYVSYLVNYGGGLVPLAVPHSGDLKKSVSPSYGTIAVRFTMFFNL